MALVVLILLLSAIHKLHLPMGEREIWSHDIQHKDTQLYNIKSGTLGKMLSSCGELAFIPSCCYAKCRCTE